MPHIPRFRFFAPLTLAVSLGVLLLLSITILYPSRAKSTGGEVSDASSAQDSKPGCKSCQDLDADADKPHLLAASYYSVNNGLTATLMLNNKGPKTLEVKPTLFSLDGQRVELPSVTVEGTSFREIDLNDFVAIAGSGFREGSLQLFHRGKDLVLGAQVRLTDFQQSLLFEEKLLEISTEIGAQRLEGLWFLPSHRATVRLILSNTSDAAVPAPCVLTASRRNRTRRSP